MNLPDFLKYAPLNRLRQMMGAELKEWGLGLNWQRFDPEEWRRLESEGLEVPLEDVIPANDGTLEYREEKIILYIRDQRISGYKGGYRFHVAECKTLEDMRRKGRYERYVVTKNRTGKFVVNRFFWAGFVEKDEECELPVCKNCLRRLNYKRYNYESSTVKDEIWRSFDIIEFFGKYPSRITKLPKHTDKTAPLDSYTSDWEVISNRYRVSVNWTCEECGINLKDHKSFLHVHHKNGVEADNSRENLQALCIGCHALKPDHIHLKNSPDYFKFRQLTSPKLG